MSNADAIALDASHPIRDDRLELAGTIALYGVAGALQFSIAAAQILLTVAVACWLALVVVRRERVDVPRFVWPLLAYAGLTLVSAAFSPDPRTSLIDCTVNHAYYERQGCCSSSCRSPIVWPRAIAPPRW